MPDEDEAFDGLATLHRKERAADGVATLTLRRADAGVFPSWQPGAHIDLVLDNGLVRQYSLCGDPAERREWQIGVLHEPLGRGGSDHIHSRLVEGDALRVHGPRNHFELEDSPSYLFIAGGIGVTPILPMVALAAARAADWRLVYGGRSRASMAYLSDLVPYGERVQVVPQDEAGLIDLASLLGDVRNDCLVYACGPEALLDAVESHCAVWPADTLRVERFTAKPLERVAPETAFDVILARSKRTLRVPAEASILSTLTGAGVEVESMCQEGTCGSCETNVVSGRPDHRDAVLTPAEKASCETMMLCVSRSLSPSLVLDL